jgi:hypothetical protein
MSARNPSPSAVVAFWIYFIGIGGFLLFVCTQCGQK